MSKMSWSSATCVASVGSEVGSLESSHVPRQASLTSSTSTWWPLNILKLRCVVPASEDSLQGMSFIRVVDEPTALFTCPQQQVRPHSQSHGNSRTCSHPSPGHVSEKTFMAQQHSELLSVVA